MERYDVLTLIAENPRAHGVFAAHERTERTVYAAVRSVARSERYEAMSEGLRPELAFSLTCEADYRGEKRLKFRGAEFDVVRTYLTRDGGIELTAQRSNADV